KLTISTIRERNQALVAQLTAENRSQKERLAALEKRLAALATPENLLKGAWLEQNDKTKPACIKVKSVKNGKVELEITHADGHTWPAVYDDANRKVEWLDGAKIPPDYKRNLIGILVYDEVIVLASPGYWLARPNADPSHLPVK